MLSSPLYLYLASQRICWMAGGAPYQQDVEVDMVDECFLEGVDLGFPAVAYDLKRQYLYLAADWDIIRFNVSSTRVSDSTPIAPDVKDLRGITDKASERKGVLAHVSALVRLYWATDNLG